MTNRNIIRNLSKEKLQQLINDSQSLGEVIKKLGLAHCGSQYSNLRKRVKNDNLDLSNFSNKRFTDKTVMFNIIPNDLVFIENSTTSRSSVKEKILKQNLIAYVCLECGNDGSWNGKKLSLQLDHLNGIRNDNRLNNLRFLCPNCHSQTSTFSGKSKRKSERTIIKKDNPFRKQKTKILWPDVEEMKKLVWSKPSSQLSIELGVSDTSIKKYCIKNSINKPSRGHWSKW